MFEKDVVLPQQKIVMLPEAESPLPGFSYDDLFLNEVCGGDHDLAKSRVEKIVSLAQAYYMDETTLGTKVYFDIKEICRKFCNIFYFIKEKKLQS